MAATHAIILPVPVLCMLNDTTLSDGKLSSFYYQCNLLITCLCFPLNVYLTIVVIGCDTHKTHLQDFYSNAHRHARTHTHTQIHRRDLIDLSPLWRVDQGGSFFGCFWRAPDVLTNPCSEYYRNISEIASAPHVYTPRHLGLFTDRLPHSPRGDRKQALWGVVYRRQTSIKSDSRPTYMCARKC